MRDEELKELRQLAEAATPGPWTVRRLMREPSLEDKVTAKVEGKPEVQAVEVDCFVQAPRLSSEHPYDIQVLGDDRNETLYPTWRADISYVAAVDPQTIIGLIDDVTRFEAIAADCLKMVYELREQVSRLKYGTLDHDAYAGLHPGAE